MGMKVRAFFWVLMAICFAYDLNLWGGIKATPGVGKVLMNDAPYQSPLAATYMVVGEKLNALLGRTEKARDLASRKFPKLVANPEGLKYLGVAQFRRAQSYWGSFCYLFGPILLVLSVVLHVTRQRQVRSFGMR